MRGLLSMLTDRHVAPQVMAAHDREFVGSLGLATLLIGVFLLFDPSGRQELFLPVLWPWWFIGVGLAVLVHAAWPHSKQVYAVGGAGLGIACLSRAVVLVIALQAGQVPDGREWRTLAGIVVWLLLGRLLRREWRRLLPIPRTPRDALA